MKGSLCSLTILVCTMLLVSICHAQSGYIYAVTGNGNMGYSGDGGPAINAQVNIDHGKIQIDPAGNIYFSDRNNSRIRKIDAATGYISTIAGTGINGFSGDGGPAVNAQINSVRSIALDTAGNLYLGDINNGRIRKIDVNGIITTVAGTGVGGHTGDGGQALNANIECGGIAVNKAGDIFLTSGNYIRKIDMQTGIISVVVGTGNPSNSGDGGLAINADIMDTWEITFDNADNMYCIAGPFTYCTRRVDAVTGIISTLPVGGIGLAIDAYGNICFSNNGVVLRWDANTGATTPVAGVGTTNAMSGIPALDAWTEGNAMAFDAYGNLYFVNNAYFAIQKITADTPAVNAASDSFNVFAMQQCNGPQFAVMTNTYNPQHTVKTYYGDGQTETGNTYPSVNTTGYMSFDHTYPMSGTYTVKHVLFSNNVAIDSVEYLFQYNMCRSVATSFYFDVNGNCNYDLLSDHPVTDVVTIVVDSNGIAVDTLSASGGFYYDMKGDIGDIYSFEIIDLPFGLQTSCSQNGVFTDTLQSAVYNSVKNIGMECNSTTNFDLSVEAALATGADQAVALIVVNNESCNMQNATLTMTFSPKYEFSTAVPVPTSQNGNVLSWDMNSLSVAGNGPQYVQVSLLPANGQILTIGDTVNTIFEITPTVGDIAPANNIIIRNDTITGPYDPNAIYVSPTSCVAQGEKLQYTVTFENLGNDTAHNVYVMDTLSSGFEMQTVKILAASHLMNVTKVNNGGYNILKFEFPNINLPDSSSPDRHGMVIYTVDMEDNFPIGSSVTNKAGIYFDYMPAVLTNVASTTVCWPASVNEVSPTANNIRIYPNPATDELTITTEQTYASYTITNSIGQVMMGQDISSKESKVNINSLSTGIYYISLKGQGGTEVRKFVKL